MRSIPLWHAATRRMGKNGWDFSLVACLVISKFETCDVALLAIDTGHFRHSLQELNLPVNAGARIANVSAMRKQLWLNLFTLLPPHAQCQCMNCNFTSGRRVAALFVLGR